jgi:hypothetical protein
MFSQNSDADFLTSVQPSVKKVAFLAFIMFFSDRIL